MLSIETVGDNIRRFKERVSEAAGYAGKSLEDISVVAAIKTQPIDIIRKLPSFGINKVGDNRVQEMLERYDPDYGLEWHFIGQLQTNKVKYIIDKVSLIHSLDRISLLQELDKEGRKRGITINALIEINAAGELNKGGMAISEVKDFAKASLKYPNVKVKGLMSVMPNTGDDKLIYHFKKIKELYDELSLTEGIVPEFLSLGMSNDFELAIRCGSNMVRPGRVIFGERS